MLQKCRAYLPIGGPNDENFLLNADAVHFSQQLIDDAIGGGTWKPNRRYYQCF
jgi:hypothetical protein